MKNSSISTAGGGQVSLRRVNYDDGSRVVLNVFWWEDHGTDTTLTEWEILLVVGTLLAMLGGEKPAKETWSDRLAREKKEKEGRV